MLCEKCGKNEATTHIRSIINGVVYESHICNYCAINKAQKNFVTRCPCCGMTFSDISESGRCGCSECYTTFYEQLLPQFNRIHGSTEYIGKKLYCDNSNDFVSIDELDNLLKKLIKEENYEQAAIVRDKIKSLKEGGI